LEGKVNKTCGKHRHKEQPLSGGGAVIISLSLLWANVRKLKIFHFSQFAYAFVFLPLIFSIGSLKFDPTSFLRLDSNRQATILANEVSVSASEPSFNIANQMTEVTLVQDDKKISFLSRASKLSEALAEQNLKFTGHLLVPGPETRLTGAPLEVRVEKGAQAVVFDQGKEYSVETINTDLRKIAEDAGLTIYPEDKVSLLPLEQDLDIKVRVERATPVRMIDAGAEKIVRTWAKTIGELLAEKGIKIQGSDTVSLANQAAVSANIALEITRFSDRVVTEKQEISIPEVYQNDDSMWIGQSTVVSEGSVGSKEVSYNVHYQNNNEIGRDVISENILVEAQPKIIKQGTKDPSTIWRGYWSGDVEQWRGLVSKYDWNVEEALLVISRESHGNPYAVSATDDHGLWQIHNGLSAYGPIIYDPDFNTQIAYQKYIGRGRNWSAWYAVQGMLW